MYHAPSSRTSFFAALTILGVLAGCADYVTAPAGSVIESASPTSSLTAPPPTAGTESGLSSAWWMLSIEENGYSHLFAFRPFSTSLTRLTSGNWNDADPSLSPDGNAIAFASDRDGFWDLYTLDLQSASITRLTSTPEYDGSPSWSPDLAWMAYETYDNGQMDIAIRSLTDPSAEPVLLTEDPASDYSPAWSPDGRKIAFVSNRTGNADIWLADLDKVSERFSDLTLSPLAAESHPIWTRDGSHLAWASSTQGPDYAGIYAWDASQRSKPAAWVGSGTWPAWSPDASMIASAVDAPSQQLISASSLSGAPLMLPAALPGRVRGIAWPSVRLPEPLPEAFQQASREAPSTQPSESATQLTDVPSQRWHIVPLENVQAHSAGLHALAVPAFNQLRVRLITDVGWDPLASLETTFVPLTAALDPGLQQDWLYTGRAFVINTLMMNAGWMVVYREDIGEQTYWRVFLRAQQQDGSQGIPLRAPPWDLNTRFQLDPQAYEAGGSYSTVPSGYWVDFTSLAELYGWHRLPAVSGWRTYYAGARVSEFAYTGGLDWYSAMLQLYPADALITPTAVLPPTRTPTRTPRPTTTPYPTWTPRNTLTPSATWTPPPPSSTPPTIIPTFPTPTP